MTLPDSGKKPLDSAKCYPPSLRLEGVQAAVMAELLTSTGLASGFIEDTQYKTRGVLFQSSRTAPSSAQSCLAAFILLKSKLSSCSRRTTRSTPLTPFHLLPTSPHHRRSRRGFLSRPLPYCWNTKSTELGVWGLFPADPKGLEQHPEHS